MRPTPRIFAAARARRALLPALFVAAAAIFAAAPARFHAHLVRADPAVNDTVSTLPTSVRLWFSEPVELGLSRMHVVRAGRDTVKIGALRREGSAATSAVADLASARLAPGSYVVTYRVVARDGHPTSGSYSFVIGSAAK
jgi:methionine-rich copper-binding protein CopC